MTDPVQPAQSAEEVLARAKSQLDALGPEILEFIQGLRRRMSETVFELGAASQTGQVDSADELIIVMERMSSWLRAFRVIEAYVHVQNLTEQEAPQT